MPPKALRRPTPPGGEDQAIEDESMNPPTDGDPEDLTIPDGHGGPEIPDVETPGMALAHPAARLKQFFGEKGSIEEIQEELSGDSSRFATFRVIQGQRGGLNHRITIKALETFYVDDPSNKTRRIGVEAGSDKEVVFEEGTFSTDDLELIIYLLSPAKGYGVDYEADPDDPTGFWTKAGLRPVEVKTVTVATGKVDPDKAAASLGTRVNRGAISTQTKRAVPSA